MALVVLNLCGEMFYVIDQRFQAQRVESSIQKKSKHFRN